MDRPFGMNPAESMEKNVELPGIVTEDHQLFRETVIENAAEQRALRSDPDMAILLYAQLLQVPLPIRLGRKMFVGVFGEPCEQRLRKVLPLYVGERILVNHVIAVPVAQQLQEIDSALASRAFEPCEELIAYMSAVSVLARTLFRGPGNPLSSPTLPREANGNVRIASGLAEGPILVTIIGPIIVGHAHQQRKPLALTPIDLAAKELIEVTIYFFKFVDFVIATSWLCH